MKIDKSERLLDLIAVLLDTRTAVSADAIHQRLPGYPQDKASFQRQFERDKKELRELGIPLVTEPGPTGDANDIRYRIPPEEYYLRDPGLDPDELAAIRLAVDTIRLDGIDAATGVEKLGADREGGADESWGATVPFNSHASVVLEAISKHRRLGFTYRGSDGDTARSVDPLHLHTSRGRWHLHAFDHGRGDRRQFRLDRIVGSLEVGADASATVTETDEPVDVRLHGWALGTTDPVPTRVWIAANQAPVARQELGDDATYEDRPDGSVVVTLDVTHVSGLRSWVLGFLDDAEVLDPPEMRADIVAWLTAIAHGGGAA